jgi:hypothetical protein
MRSSNQEVLKIRIFWHASWGEGVQTLDTALYRNRLYLPKRKCALISKKMTELQEADTAQKRRKALCNAEIQA